MAWLSAIIVIRDAPGSPNDFLNIFQFNGTDCVNIPITEPSTMSCESVYNLTEQFPSCVSVLSNCVCTNNNSSEDMLGCLPTVDCLYGDSSVENLNELCSSGFLSLIGQEEDGCQYGTLNNFQVHVYVKSTTPNSNLVLKNYCLRFACI